MRRLGGGPEAKSNQRFRGEGKCGCVCFGVSTDTIVHGERIL
jgi:hypothetical protein